MRWASPSLSGAIGWGPIGPIKGARYTTLVNYVMDGTVIDQLYNLTARMRDYFVNPMVDGAVSLCSIYSYYLDIHDES